MIRPLTFFLALLLFSCGAEPEFAGQFKIVGDYLADANCNPELVTHPYTPASLDGDMGLIEDCGIVGDCWNTGGGIYFNDFTYAVDLYFYKKDGQTYSIFYDDTAKRSAIRSDDRADGYWHWQTGSLVLYGKYNQTIEFNDFKMPDPHQFLSNKTHRGRSHIETSTCTEDNPDCGESCTHIWAVDISLQNMLTVQE